jgi:two-component system CheB/CheR fusion protein
LQAAIEELQASNEELQASNEELQSTNEELQSVNEELYTVNAEYQRKIIELTELTNDMDNLLSSTEIGTIFLDDSLRIRKFTPQIAQTFALVPHDVGRSIETFAHRLDHPELVDDLRRVLASGEPVERELLDVRGKAFFLRILPYRVKGTPAGVVLTLIDVTGLRAAEDALFHERYLLNSLLSSVPDAIYFKDARGRFIRVNRAMAERLGVRDAAQLVGKTALDLPERGVALELQRQDEEVVRTGEPQLYSMEERPLPDGGRAWDLVTRLPLKDAKGESVGIIVIFRNVTEQKLAEDQAMEAVRRRDHFLAMLSHELRNPLGAIVTATDALKNRRESRHPALVDVLERQARQMARLLDDLLEASRVTQNKIELTRSVLDLRTVVKDAIEAVGNQIEARRLDLRVELAETPIHVDGDPARLQQITVNLLNNATKYTNPGGTISVFARIEDGEAVVRVRDTGVGIPKEMLDSVFDLFVQSQRTLDRSAGGIGVGLTLVKSLVTMHGGTVSAHSDGENKGTEMVFRLPLADAAQVRATERAERRPLPRELRVLVVEDNEDTRVLLCELLEDAGFRCASASNGVAALEQILKGRPAIAILDVGLPEMDGFEVARRVRADPSNEGTYLIALTGYGRESDREATRKAGFDEHLVKPVRPNHLLELLASLGRERVSRHLGNA